MPSSTTSRPAATGYAVASLVCVATPLVGRIIHSWVLLLLGLPLYTTGILLAVVALVLGRSSAVAQVVAWLSVAMAVLAVAYVLWYVHVYKAS